MTTGKKIAIYSRKSKFTGKGESIDNQIELCKQYIRAHYSDMGESDILIYEDEGFSGGNTRRPQFKEMMTHAQAEGFFAVVCYRLDRISRNIGDFAKLIEELEGLGISFVSIKERFDTSSPMGRAMMYISSVFSQLERETIAERIRDNMHELSKTGRWLGGVTPTGYVSESAQNITVDGKAKKVCKLRLIPDEAEIIQTIFRVFLQSNSLSKTETWLIQNGYKTKNGRFFTRFAIRNILTNPVYMAADEDAHEYLTNNDVDLFSEKKSFDGKHGIMAYNRTIQKTGRANQVRPMKEWIVSVGRHEPLISGGDWVQVQKYLEQNSSKSFRKPRSNVALLSGLLHCACGDYMRPKLSKRTNVDGELIYTYLCALKEKSRSHSCQMKNINGNILDKAICEEIKKLDRDSAEFVKQLELGKKRLRGNIDEGHKKSEAIKTRIAELQDITVAHTFSDIEFDTICQLLYNFESAFDLMDMEQKRAALRLLVRRIEWGGEDVHLYLFGSDVEPLRENSK